MSRTKLLCLTIGSAALLGLTGCAGPTAVSTLTHSEQGVTVGSRATLYSSLSEMADDSAATVTATVESQRTVTDRDAKLRFTIQTVHVTDVVRGGVSAGDTLEVRQIGDGAHPGSAPAPLLRVGSDYLLYLTPSGLPGDAAHQFYVTGGAAGLYAADGDGHYSRMATDTGDDLPDTITLDAALG